MDQPNKHKYSNEPSNGSDADTVDTDLQMKESSSHSHSRSSSQDEVYFASGPFYAHLDDLDDEEEDELTVG